MFPTLLSALSEHMQNLHHESQTQLDSIQATVRTIALRPESTAVLIKVWHLE
jgi:hypothetical protein